MTDVEAIEAAVRRANTHGWSAATLGDPDLAGGHFPRGVNGAIEAWLRLVDERVDAAAAPEDLAALRTPARIRRVMELRLRLLEPDRDALRSAMTHLALPWNVPAGVAILARSVSAIWHTAGDTSGDFSWYTRRATLAVVYSATLAFWMRPSQPDLEEVLSFLDRRLQELPKPKRKAA